MFVPVLGACLFLPSVWRYENMKSWKTRLLRLNVRLPLPVESNFLPNLLTRGAEELFSSSAEFSAHVYQVRWIPQTVILKNGLANTVLCLFLALKDVVSGPAQQAGLPFLIRSLSLCPSPRPCCLAHKSCSGCSFRAPSLCWHTNDPR